MLSRVGKIHILLYLNFLLLLLLLLLLVPRGAAAEERPRAQGGPLSGDADGDAGPVAPPAAVEKLYDNEGRAPAQDGGSDARALPRDQNWRAGLAGVHRSAVHLEPPAGGQVRGLQPRGEARDGDVRADGQVIAGAVPGEGWDQLRGALLCTVRCELDRSLSWGAETAELRVMICNGELEKEEARR